MGDKVEFRYRQSNEEVPSCILISSVVQLLAFKDVAIRSRLKQARRLRRLMSLYQVLSSRSPSSIYRRGSRAHSAASHLGFVQD